jgi:hypothetical protein
LNQYGRLPLELPLDLLTAPALRDPQIAYVVGELALERQSFCRQLRQAAMGVQHSPRHLDGVDIGALVLELLDKAADIVTEDAVDV